MLLTLPQFIENIGISHQGEGQLPVALLDFLRCSFLGAIVCHCRSLDYCIHPVILCQHGLFHFPGRANLDGPHASRHSKTGGTTYQHHLCSPFGGYLRNGIAHATCGTVAQEAHRIKGFFSASGGDENSLPLQGFRFCKEVKDLLHDGGRLRQTALALNAAGQMARSRFDDTEASLLQHRKVGLSGWVFIHARVHGRSK